MEAARIKNYFSSSVIQNFIWIFRFRFAMPHRPRSHRGPGLSQQAFLCLGEWVSLNRKSASGYSLDVLAIAIVSYPVFCPFGRYFFQGEKEDAYTSSFSSSVSFNLMAPSMTPSTMGRYFSGQSVICGWSAGAVRCPPEEAPG